LEREYEEGEKTSRLLFYFADALNNAGQVIKAVEIFKEYLTQYRGFHDEVVWAHIRLVRCLRVLKRNGEAFSYCFQCLALDQRFAEVWLELARLYYDAGLVEKALAVTYMIPTTAPNTTLFLESNCYKDQPLRMRSFACQHLNKIPEAIKATRKILGFVPNDQDMIQRLRDLERKQEFRVERPGAIGDIVMTLHLIRNLKKKHPNKKIVYYCHPNFMNVVKLCPDVDIIRSSELKKEVDVQLVGYPLAEGYPEVPMERHLIEYFAQELEVEPDFNFLPNFTGLVGDETREFVMKNGPFATVHLRAGWSPYKNWPTDRWQLLIDHLKEEYPMIDFIQIGAEDDPELKNVVDFRGKTTITESIFLIKQAVCHFGGDSFSNHVTNLLPRTPAMIFWGSTSPIGSGYRHNLNIYLDKNCQPCYREYDWMSVHPKGMCPYDKTQSWEDPEHPCLLEMPISVAKNTAESLISSALLLKRN
jgi:ADP-heptose:LPS heptosyltransferase